VLIAGYATSDGGSYHGSRREPEAVERIGAASSASSHRGNSGMTLAAGLQQLAQLQGSVALPATVAN